MKPVIFVLGISLASAVAEEPLAVDWLALQAAYRRYESQPSAQNAKTVLKYLPDPTSGGKFTNSQAEAATIDYIYNHLHVLDRRMDRGSESAMRLAFRLFSISDAHFTETLEQMIGDQINKNPRMFLRLVQEHKVRGPGLDDLVTNNGIYEDSPAACRDYRQKLAALRSVREAGLLRTRDEAIKALAPIVNGECAKHKTN